MAQINIRVEKDTEEILTFLAEHQGVSKSTIAKKMLNEGINKVLFPAVASLYKEGKISLKKIVDLTKMDILDVLENLSALLDDAPITADIDEYTSGIAKKVMEMSENLDHARTILKKVPKEQIADIVRMDRDDR
jgi:DNA-binding transcriptional regulator GbsR (MarR family)